MKKIFLLLALLFSASNLFGAYKVKIAVYKNHANLMGIISKISVAEYRKNIIIEKKNHLYYVTSTLYESKSEAMKALKVYKKVFSDAFIDKAEQKKIAPAATEVLAQTPERTEKKQINAFDAKRLLENKTVYLCNENVSKNAKKQIAKMDFKNEYVVYSKLGKDMPPIKIPYTFDKDCVILPRSGIEFKYKIYQEGEHFLSAKSFINDNEGNHFRYYFDKEAALSFAAGH